MKNLLRSILAAAGVMLSGLADGETVKPEIEEGYEPIQIIRTRELVFPHRLIRDSIDQGEASILVMISDQGQLLDWLVIGYSHPLFAQEVLDGLLKWKFIPAYLQGKAITTRTELRFIFKNSAIIRVLANDAGRIARHTLDHRKGGFWTFICRPEDLDAPLDAKVEISPMPPDRLGATAQEGKVIVDFLVDREGKVRMPLIISADDEAFANSVLLAISDWRYEVPRRVGQPMITRVRRQFTFTPVST